MTQIAYESRSFARQAWACQLASALLTHACETWVREDRVAQNPETTLISPRAVMQTS